MTATLPRYVGQPIPRVEDLRLVTGAGSYGADFDRPGQVHARVVRSQVSHGRIRAIDVSAAARMPGVVRVVTAADIPDVRVPIRLFPTENAQRALQAPLARDVVRYVGDPVAVVVASDPYLAEDAADTVAVEIEPLAPVLDPVLAEASDAVLVHPAIGGNVVDRLSMSHGEGIERLFAEADVVIREHLTVHRHGAAPLEPRCLLAEHDPAGAQLTVWGAAKVKHFNRRILAALLGTDPESIRLIEGDVGGGFGARGEFYPEDFLIPWLALELERPVKWVEDRRENLIALNHSREQRWDVECAAKRDGTLLAFRARGRFNQGAYVRTHGSLLLQRLTLNHLPGPYRWQAWELDMCTVLTNKTPAGTFRGPGQFEPTFIRERMVDLVARELGADPLEVRLRNLVGPDDVPYDTGLRDIDTGRAVLYETGDFPHVLRTLLDHVDYEALRAQTEDRRARGELIGLAARPFVEMGNPGIFEQARLVAHPDGSFTVHVGIASVGQGVETVLSQIAADVLRVPIDRVRVSYQDTSLAPEGQGAFSSRATVWGGSAIVGVVRELLKEARRAASERLEISEGDLELVSGGLLQPRGQPSAAMPLAELASQAFYRYEPEGGSQIMSGANVCQVVVDPVSGAVKLLRYAVAYEIGRAINPLTVEGQIRGAAAQGLSGALLEEFAYTDEGQPVSTSFMDYMQATASEIPDIDVVVLEFGQAAEDDPLAGVKGAGEGGIIGTGATLVAAVEDAVGSSGSPLTALPLTPERIHRLVAESRGPGADQA